MEVVTDYEHLLLKRADTIFLALLAKDDALNPLPPEKKVARLKLLADLAVAAAQGIATRVVEVVED
jgi:hypothetical protein